MQTNHSAFEPSFIAAICATIYSSDNSAIKSAKWEANCSAFISTIKSSFNSAF